MAETIACIGAMLGGLRGGGWQHPKVPPLHQASLKFTAGFDSSRPHGCHYSEYVGDRTRFGVTR